MRFKYIIIVWYAFLSIQDIFGKCTCTNPIRTGDAPDPFVMYKNGYYYGCHTTGGDVRIYKPATLQNIFNSESKSVWGGKPDIQAPEIHYLNGKWCNYTCYNTGSYWMNTIVLEGKSQDPLGSYTLKAQLSTLSNTIDASVWQDTADHQNYPVYSKMDGTDNWINSMREPDKYFDIQEVDNPALNNTNGVQGQHNPCPLEADIWVLAGQSNMQGAGRTPDTLTDPKIWMMHLDNRWMVARCPLHRIFEATAPAYAIASYQLSGDPEKSKEKTRQFFREQEIISRRKPIGGVGPGIYFARQMLASTGRPIGLIPCALGGSTIDQWDPVGKVHGDSSLYGAMLNRVRSAGIQNIKGLVWYQGESEAMLGQPETYKAKLLNLIDSFRQDIGRPDLPVLIVQIGRFIIRDPVMDFNWEALRNAQLNAIKERSNLFITSGIDLELDDCVHLSSVGNQRLGARLGETALSHIYKIPGHGDQILPQSLELKKDSLSGSSYLHLHFNGVNGNLKSTGLITCFEIRFGNKIRISHVISKVETDPDDASGLRLYLSAIPEEPVFLVCGPGTNPHMNITDSRDMPIPAFGPLEINFESLKNNNIILK